MDVETEALYLDLHTACSLGETKFVEKILKGGININEKNNEGWTPLMYACYGSHEPVVRQLLNKGASTAELNHKGQTALILATKAGCLQIVQISFQRSLLNHADDSGRTALYCAVEYNFKDIVAYLIQEGADLNFSCQGKSIIKLAEENGHRAMIDLLQARGARLHPQRWINPCLNKDFTDLQTLLQSLSLEKYWPIFEKQRVNLENFLKLNEDDLESLGIKLLGPRRKMSIAINTLKTQKPSK